MIRVAGYCRVSTDREDQANSFDAQKRYFRAYIGNHPDWELHDIYADEGITGTNTQKRPQFNRMIRDAEAGKFTLILTKEVSRFSRNILDTIRFTRQLKSLGVSIRFVNDGIDTADPDSELRLSIMSSIAQEESRRTSSRVVWGQTRQMERGVVFGPSMLGYDVQDGKLTIEPEGAETVRLIFRKYALEQVGTSDIARYLTSHGYQTRQGSTQWKSNAIIKILKNEKYVGDLVQKKTYTPDYLTHQKQANKGQVPMVILRDHHEPIISRELWDLAQARLRENNKHRKGSGGHSNCYLFSGKIQCGECGRSFVGRVRYRKDGTKIRRWCCVNGDCQVGKLLRDDDAMEMLKTVLHHLPVELDTLISDVTQQAMQAWEVDNPESSKSLQAEMNRIQQKKEAMLDSYFSGSISKEDMMAMKEHYDRRLTAIQLRLNEATGKQPDASELSRMAKSILMGETESLVFCKTILESITVYKDRHMDLRLKNFPIVFRFEE